MVRQPREPGLGAADARRGAAPRAADGRLPALPARARGGQGDDRGDDFASALLEIHDEDPEALTQEEIASILFSLSFAGHETTNNLIGNCVRRLLEAPERWARLVAEPALIAGAVDEMLRFDPSVPVWRRVTTRPVTLGGIELPEGAKLFLWLAAAGRDADVFPEPERVRSRARQLAPDARVRARHPLLHRVRARAPGGDAGARGAHAPLPGLRLAPPDQEVPFHPNISFRGPQVLWVQA